LAGHESEVTDAVFSPDGQRVVTASSDINYRLMSVSDKYQMIAYLRNGSRNKTAYLWDVSSGRLLQTLAGHGSTVTHATFSPPDGQRVVTASWDKTARLWDVSSGKLLQTLAGHESFVNYATFGPGGQVVTASWDKTARLWDVSSGRLLQTLAGHESYVTHAAFSPNGQHVVTVSADAVHLWEMNSGRLLQILDRYSDPENSFYNTPDRLWQLVSLKTLIDYAKAQVPRQLTVKQREQFFLPIDPMMVENIEKAKTLVTKGEELATAGNILAAMDQFKQALALDSSLGFQPESKAMLLVAQQAKKLAEAGDIPKATAAFQTVQSFGFQLSVTPEVEAKRVAASAWLSEGEQLAGEGKIEEAMAKFKQALDWDTTLQFDPKTKANQIYAPFLVSKGEGLAPQGQIDPALANYTQAQQLDPEVEITAESWETLCYFGSFYQQAEKVSVACERAEVLKEMTVERWVEGWLMGEEGWR
jgi:tetratricopeptide (TPR) repeat protein